MAKDTEIRIPQLLGYYLPVCKGVVMYEAPPRAFVLFFFLFSGYLFLNENLLNSCSFLRAYKAQLPLLT